MGAYSRSNVSILFRRAFTSNRRMMIIIQARIRLIPAQISPNKSLITAPLVSMKTLHEDGFPRTRESIFNHASAIDKIRLILDLAETHTAEAPHRITETAEAPDSAAGPDPRPRRERRRAQWVHRDRPGRPG